MAGITGFFYKNKSKNQVRGEEILDKMMRSLSYNASQKEQRIYTTNVCFGNSVPVSSKQNHNYVFDEKSGLHIVIDGLLFLNPDTKKIMAQKYSMSIELADQQFLPVMFLEYGNEMTEHLSGYYNVFVFNEKNQYSVLFNDRLGYSPLFIYENDSVFVFASKIESILSSGLMDEITFDTVSFAEHLFFNYVLSDNTYIKHIQTLPPAKYLTLKIDSPTESHTYWVPDELFTDTVLDKQKSIDTIDKALHQVINKISNSRNGFINASFTGGWDSRVVYSYLLPYKKEQIKAYSFGAPGAPDIEVPQQICSELGISYQSYLLDEEYYSEVFNDLARKNIELSNGSRNIKRTHYMYTVEKIASDSDLLISGIFGDEVFKIGKPMGGEVISKNVIKCLESGFNSNIVLDDFKKSDIASLFKSDSDALINEFEQRMFTLEKYFSKWPDIRQRYFVFRFSMNLRKYFGNEINSYNDFVYCYSPFIDIDFLRAFAKTKYMISRFDFKEASFINKVNSSKLYFELVDRNFPKLTSYNTSRGFSMKDTSTLTGNIRIILRKFFFPKLYKSVDGFNTSSGVLKFENVMASSGSNYIFKDNSHSKGVKKEELLSLRFWSDEIERKYLK